MADPLRIGVLSAARIVPLALLEPARTCQRVKVTAIAARDVERARQLAERFSIQHVEGSYDALVESPHIDAVYVPLPASHHAEWTLRALAAGKHVLCEKPFASNAVEAERMVAAADTAGRVLVEAFHYRYHPLAERILEICNSGELGPLQYIEATFSAPILDQNDIRYVLALGGGATMDLGCYPLHWARLVTGTEPRVQSAVAVEASPGIDVSMTAELVFPNGPCCTMHCSMSKEFQAELRVCGERSNLLVTNPLVPHTGHSIQVTPAGPGSARTETVPGGTTYAHQLDAFAAAVLDRIAPPTGGEDAIDNMRLIDAVYRRAGMTPRGTTPQPRSP